jgi:hypothetical protein
MHFSVICGGGKNRRTYKKRESLSELGDLLFFKGILFTKPSSAYLFPFSESVMFSSFVDSMDDQTASIMMEKGGRYHCVVVVRG